MAAAAAEVIPFSCIICFDEFNTTDRSPMVLPCGHTYVCLACTKRLKRCMECREPLFLPSANSQNQRFENNNPAPPLLGSSRSTRFTPNTSSIQPKAVPNNPIRLPIPKNLVLLSMMEAAERQSRHMKSDSISREQGKERSVDDYYESDSVQEEDEEETFDLDSIIAGMATLTGPCGTYAVREEQGLVVLPKDPRRKKEHGTVVKEQALANLSPKPKHEEQRNSFSSVKSLIFCRKSPDAAMRSEPTFVEETKVDEPALNQEMESPSSQQAHTGQPLLIRSTSSLESDEDDSVPPRKNLAEPFRVEYGQKLQVVSFEDGVVTLARNQGFICANYSQLAKVGGPLEESCRLEGLLDTIRHRGNDLLKTYEDNRKIEVGLMNHIKSAQARQPSCPVISEIPARHAAPQVGFDMIHFSSQSGDQHEIIHLNQIQSTPTSNDHLPSIQTTDIEPYHGTLRQQLSSDHTDVGPTMPSSPISIDNSDLPVAEPPRQIRPASLTSTASFDSRSNDNNAVALSFGCGVLSTELLGTVHNRNKNNAAQATGLSVRGLSATIDTSPDHYTRGIPHNRGPPAPASASFDSVNFRSMSNHCGLSRSSSKRNYNNSTTPRNYTRGGQYQQNRFNNRPRRLWMMGEHRGVSLSIGSQNNTRAAATRPNYDHS